MAGFAITPLRGIGLVEPGAPLGELLLEALAAEGMALQNGDVLAVAQKIVSKAEGRMVDLAAVEPSTEAMALAAQTEKDPRLVQLVLDESTEVVRHKPGVLIVRHRLGLVGAHAGIDQSNIDHAHGQCALLLPKDPDGSAERLRQALSEATGCTVAVLITDSANRPWRLGTVGIAIGAAGLEALDDRRGGSDIYGRELNVTLVNRADSLAAAATLAMGETTERTPAALVRGIAGSAQGRAEHRRQRAADIVRPAAEDLFR